MDSEEDILALQLDDVAQEKRVPPPPPSTRDQRRGASIDFSITNAFQMNDVRLNSAERFPQKLNKGNVDLWIDDEPDDDITVNQEQNKINEQWDNQDNSFDVESIPVIPDLQDVMVEDLMLQTAAAPSANKFIDYQQLEEAIMKHSAFAVFNGIELSVLIKRLVATSFLVEEDVPWKWISLIADVTSNLQNDEA